MKNLLIFVFLCSAVAENGDYKSGNLVSFHLLKLLKNS